MTDIFDIFIIGGGINGCGIARDAAGRGYSVYLAEMNDLGSGTSSWSTKIIHGGLRYLEHFEFRLVREALKEREILWNLAPHIIHPLRFILPHHKDLRPAWLLRLGLFIYDRMGGCKYLPKSQTLNLSKDETGEVLKPDFSKAFSFYDCRVDDVRLVVLNAQDAAAKGAYIQTRTKVVNAVRQNNVWHVTVEDTRTGEQEHIQAKLLINAAGPWADHVLSEGLQNQSVHNIRLVQGSHIVVKKKFDHNHAYFFQNADDRIFFAIPYHDDFTLIGTTDVDYAGDPAHAEISQDEVDYLCSGASTYFERSVTPDDIVWHFSGVRSLYDDGASKAQEATRDYVVRVDGKKTDAKLINVFGGKITTYRRLSESVMKKVESILPPKGKSWTQAQCLPGGDFPMDGFDDLMNAIHERYRFLTRKTAIRLARTYGTKTYNILGDAQSMDVLGQNFGYDLTPREVEYLIREEWAQTAEDVLWRRTKLGLYFNQEQVRGLQNWIRAYYMNQEDIS